MASYWPYASRSSSICLKRFTDICHALEYLQSSSSDTHKKNVFLTETPGHYGPFRRPVVGGDTFLPLAPVLGPGQQKNGLSPSSTVHDGQYDTTYFEVCDIRVATGCGIHGHTLRAISLKQLVCTGYI